MCILNRSIATLKGDSGSDNKKFCFKKSFRLVKAHERVYIS